MLTIMDISSAAAAEGNENTFVCVQWQSAD